MKSQNEKYCGECGEIIRKNAYICPHCGVKQGGINIDSEQLSRSAKVGGFTIVLITAILVRWMARAAIYLGMLGGAGAAIFNYVKMQEYTYYQDDFYGSLAVMAIVPFIGYFISSVATRFLKRLGYDGKLGQESEKNNVTDRS